MGFNSFVVVSPVWFFLEVAGSNHGVRGERGGQCQLNDLGGPVRLELVVEVILVSRVKVGIDEADRPFTGSKLQLGEPLAAQVLARLDLLRRTARGESLEARPFDGQPRQGEESAAR